MGYPFHQTRDGPCNEKSSADFFRFLYSVLGVLSFLSFLSFLFFFLVNDNLGRLEVVDGDQLFADADLDVRR